MIDSILGWPPILWTARIALLIVLAGAGLAALLYFARFLRPKHFLGMLQADLPRLREIGGSGKLLGQELALNAKLDDAREEQVRSHERRLEQVEQRQKGMENILRQVVEHVLRKEEQNDLFD